MPNFRPEYTPRDQDKTRQDKTTERLDFLMKEVHALKQATQAGSNRPPRNMFDERGYG